MRDDDFLDPIVANYFASQVGTPALALYQRWKAGETLHVRTVPLWEGETPHEFTIVPVRTFGTGPVVGATVLLHGRPVPELTGKCWSDSEFLEWCELLEVAIE